MSLGKQENYLMKLLIKRESVEAPKPQSNPRKFMKKLNQLKNHQLCFNLLDKCQDLLIKGQ